MTLGACAIATRASPQRTDAVPLPPGGHATVPGLIAEQTTGGALREAASALDITGWIGHPRSWQITGDF